MMNKLFKKLLIVSCVATIGVNLVACKSNKQESASSKNEIIIGMDIQ
ncbi:Uncharacterised protein [Clostridioides difficile]|nr:Uncharacterised protein [Clostridioides difficile]